MPLALRGTLLARLARRTVRMLRSRSGTPPEPAPPCGPAAYGPNVDPTVVVGVADLDPQARIAEHVKFLGAVSVMGDVGVGRYTVVNGPDTYLLSRINPIQIGGFCSVASHVLIIEYGHPVDRVTTHFVLRHVFGEEGPDPVVSGGSITVGSDVWIGSQSVVLGGTTIGHGAVIGANSVVTGSIPPYAIAHGSPARVYRYRFEPAIVERLLATEWWEWPRDRILRNRALFANDLNPGLLDAIRD